MPRSGAIAAAVVWRAQMRAALEHLAGNPDVRLTGVVARGLRPAPRILRNAAGFWRVGLVLVGPPVRGPLPHIADHVVDAVAVRWECRHRRGTRVAVGLKVFV